MLKIQQNVCIGMAAKMAGSEAVCTCSKPTSSGTKRNVRKAELEEGNAMFCLLNGSVNGTPSRFRVFVANRTREVRRTNG